MFIFWKIMLVCLSIFWVLRGRFLSFFIFFNNRFLFFKFGGVVISDFNWNNIVWMLLDVLMKFLKLVILIVCISEIFIGIWDGIYMEFVGLLVMFFLMFDEFKIIGIWYGLSMFIFLILFNIRKCGFLIVLVVSRIWFFKGLWSIVRCWMFRLLENMVLIVWGGFFGIESEILILKNKYLICE